MKKLLIAIVGILLGLSVIVVVISSRNKPSVSPVSQNSPTTIVAPTPVVKLKKYSDPSGFSFQYPDSLILTPKNPLPKNAYASVELTLPKDNALIALTVEDSNLANLKSAVTATSSTSLKLADLSAVQFDSNNNKTTLALDQGVLFTLTLNPSNATDSWTTAYNQIVSSFAFDQPSNSIEGSPGNDVVYEGEETVE